MDAAPSESDAARLLRALAVRAFTLALLVGIAGDSLLTAVYALTGLGLLRAPVDTPRSGSWPAPGTRAGNRHRADGPGDI